MWLNSLDLVGSVIALILIGVIAMLGVMLCVVFLLRPEFWERQIDHGHSHWTNRRTSRTAMLRWRVPIFTVGLVIAVITLAASVFGVVLRI